MIIYEAYNEITRVQFLDESKANSYAQENSLQVRTIEVEIENQEPIIDRDSELRKDLEFGNRLILQFLLDNRNSPIAFDNEVSIQLLVKFQKLEALCRLGDIKNVALLLPTIETDEVFTQERKDNYISMTQQHLNNK